MRKELAKDAERSRREVLVTCSKSSTTSIARSTRRERTPARSHRHAAAGRRDGPQQFLAKLEGFGVKRIDVAGPAVRSGAARGRHHRAGARRRDQDGRVVGVDPPRLPDRRRRAAAGVGGRRAGRVGPTPSPGSFSRRSDPLGDVHPMVALALELQRRGHDPSSRRPSSTATRSPAPAWPSTPSVPTSPRTTRTCCEP